MGSTTRNTIAICRTSAVWGPEARPRSSSAPRLGGGSAISNARALEIAPPETRGGQRRRGASEVAPRPAPRPRARSRRHCGARFDAAAPRHVIALDLRRTRARVLAPTPRQRVTGARGGCPDRRKSGNMDQRVALFPFSHAAQRSQPPHARRPCAFRVSARGHRSTAPFEHLQCTAPRGSYRSTAPHANLRSTAPRGDRRRTAPRGRGQPSNAPHERS